MEQLLTNTGIPPEDVPVKDVEGEVSEAAWDFAVEVLAIERTGGETQGTLIKDSSCLTKQV